ncbi:2-amino-4-hydroxy-6-hydroxymethyldihydropteridine diphosphokinase [Aromatoleum petrolei]|uniref:2-amino-4-hydroxy-6-hydroxymethyldihydropteridine pyrophosphokinase n=1 Tax=Aromatoleum petrolei TaxID=76116 RepID=A0ABX1MT28_9RHOO|nr:2-amino-4-hydroxy-6-hydroxymethyldihydropteridine diphosphokinase [Aromatoleum petrolei]NMF91127.1 2-amino-4-hydroxy-6-hydroxymethyldihydropteridine diphosphokinase [Aromatoleum petrolei]QTQ35573.1 2-amino-4-hydroxy-6-hydroxymethyldihydropteridine pyrophosphokinase [Aromatoleum petrolei]
MTTHRPPPEGGPVRAFIALGANLGDAAATLDSAFAALDALPGTRLIARSGLYRTAPIGVTAHPDYLNAVAEVETTLPARKLLNTLLTLEALHGRTRETELAPRTLDLDLLLYGDASISQPGLEIPHPRMHQRAFVLVPLAEIAPDTAIPGHGRAADLLDAVGDQRIERIS